MAEQAPIRREDGPERFRNIQALSAQTHLLRLNVGGLPGNLPQDMTERDMNLLERKLNRQTEFTNLHDVYFKEGLRLLQKVQQHNTDMIRLQEKRATAGEQWWKDEGQKLHDFHLAEFTVASQAVMLKRYTPDAIQEVCSFMEMALNDIPSLLVHLPPAQREALREQEKKARNFLANLRGRVQERVAFENTWYAQQKLWKLTNIQTRLTRISRELQDIQTRSNDRLTDFSQRSTDTERARSMKLERTSLLTELRSMADDLKDTTLVAKIDAALKQPSDANLLAAVMPSIDAAVTTMQGRARAFGDKLPWHLYEAQQVGRLRQTTRAIGALDARLAQGQKVLHDLKPAEAGKATDLLKNLQDTLSQLEADTRGEKKLGVPQRTALEKRYRELVRDWSSGGGPQTVIAKALEEVSAALATDDKRTGLERLDAAERQTLEEQRDGLETLSQVPSLLEQREQLVTQQAKEAPELEKAQVSYLEQRLRDVQSQLSSAAFQLKWGPESPYKKAIEGIQAKTELLLKGKPIVIKDLEAHVQESTKLRQQRLNEVQDALRKATKPEDEKKLAEERAWLKNYGDAEADALRYARYLTDPASRTGSAELPAFSADRDAEMVLDQRLLHLLAGRGDQTGYPHPRVEAGYYPQQLYTAALSARYEQFIEQEKEIAKSKKLDPKQKEQALAFLNRARTQQLQKTISVTNRLVQYQLQMGEMVGSFDQYRQFLDRDAISSNMVATPGLTKKLAEDAQLETSVFHLERIQDVVNTANRVFTKEAVNDAFQMNKLLAMNEIGKAFEMILQGVTLIIPPGQVRQQAQDFLKQAVPASFESLMKDAADEIISGHVPDKDGELKGAIEEYNQLPNRPKQLDANKFNPNALPAPERDVLRGIIIARKMRSLKDATLAFIAKNHAKDISDTVDTYKLMPPPSAYAGGQVDQAQLKAVSRDKRVNLDEVKAFANQVKGRELTPEEQNKAATYAAMLLMQVRVDWGTIGEGGFIHEYAAFLGSVEQTVNNRLELISAAKAAEMSFDALWQKLVLAAGGVVTAALIVAVGGIGVGAAAVKLVPMGLKAAKWGGVRWWNSLKARPGGTVVGSAVVIRGGVNLYNDVQEYRRLEEGFNLEKERVKEALKSRGWETTDGGETWVYKDGGDVLATVKLSDFDNAKALQQNWQIGQMAADGAEIAAGFWIMAKGLGGKAGWIGLAVVALIEFGKVKMDEERHRKLLDAFPIDVICVMSTEQLIQMSNWRLQQEMSRTNIDDNAERRKKLFMAHFFQEMSKFPGLAQDFFREGSLESFYKNDFDLVYKLYLLRLRKLVEQRKGTNTTLDISWENMKKGVISENGYLWMDRLGSKNIGPAEMRQAMREAAILFREHQRERDYRVAVRVHASESAKPEVKGAKAGEQGLLVSELEAIAAASGEQEVLGGPLKKLQADPKAWTRGGKEVSLKTRIEDLADTLWNDDKKATGKHKIPGIPGMDTMPGGAIDLDNPQAVYKLIKDPALRKDLEFASFIETNWSSPSFGDALLISIGLKDKPKDAPDKAIRYFQSYLSPAVQRDDKAKEMPADEATRLREQIKAVVAEWEKRNPKAPRPIELAGLDIETIDETGGVNLRTLVSQAVVALLSPERGDVKKTFQRFNKLEKRLPGGGPPPFLYCKGNSGMRLPVLDNEGPEYQWNRLAAVFYETTTLGNGQKVMLQTCFFADPANLQNVTVWQRAEVGDNRKDSVAVLSNKQTFTGMQQGGAPMLQMMLEAFASDPSALKRFSTVRETPPSAENQPEVGNEDGAPFTKAGKAGEAGGEGGKDDKPEKPEKPVGSKTTIETEVSPRGNVTETKVERTDDTYIETRRTPRRVWPPADANLLVKPWSEVKPIDQLWVHELSVTRKEPDGSFTKEEWKVKKFNKDTQMVTYTVTQESVARNGVKTLIGKTDKEVPFDEMNSRKEPTEGKPIQKTKVTRTYIRIGEGKYGEQVREESSVGLKTIVKVSTPKMVGGRKVVDTLEITKDDKKVTTVEKKVVDAQGPAGTLRTTETTTVQDGGRTVKTETKAVDGRTEVRELDPKASAAAKKDVFKETIQYQQGDQIVTVSLTPVVDGKTGAVTVQKAEEKAPGFLPGQEPIAAPKDGEAPKPAETVVTPLEGEKATLIDEAQMQKSTDNLRLAETMYQKAIDKNPAVEGKLFNGQENEKTKYPSAFSLRKIDGRSVVIVRRNSALVTRSLQDQMNKQYEAEKLRGGRNPPESLDLNTFVSPEERVIKPGSNSTKVAPTSYAGNVFTFYTWSAGQKAVPAQADKTKYELYAPMQKRTVTELTALTALKAKNPLEYAETYAALTTAYQTDPDQSIRDVLNLCSFDVVNGRTTKSLLFEQIRGMLGDKPQDGMKKLVDTLLSDDIKGYISKDNIPTLLKKLGVK
jgi:hypothetical protein